LETFKDQGGKKQDEKHQTEWSVWRRPLSKEQEGKEGEQGQNPETRGASEKCNWLCDRRKGGLQRETPQQGCILHEEMSFLATLPHAYLQLLSLVS